MATLGDRVLSLVITEKHFRSGKPKGEITIERAEEEKEDHLKEIKVSIDISKYAFKKDYYSFEDQLSGREKVSIGGHEEFIEAIIAAIYLDRGMKYVRSWIYKHIMK